MKKIIKISCVFFLTSLLLISCDSSNSCNNFLNDYEEIVDEYIEMIRKIKDNPMDVTIQAEATEIMEKATKMGSEGADCDDPKFAGKLLKLQQKMATEAAGIMK